MDRSIVRTIFIVCSVAFWSNSIAFCQVDVDPVLSAERLPFNTSLYCHCDDTQEFLSRVKRSSLFRAICSTPYFDEMAIQAKLKLEPDDVEAAGLVENAGFDQLINLFQGPSEFYVIGDNSEKKWALIFGIQKIDLLTKAIELIRKKDTLVGLKFTSIIDRSEWNLLFTETERESNVVLEVHRTVSNGLTSSLEPVCCIWLGESTSTLVACSDAQQLLSVVTEIKSSTKEAKARSLADNRKFLEVVGRTKNWSVGRNLGSLFFYVDPNEYSKHELKAMISETMSDENLSDISVGELLCYGGSLVFFEDNFDFDARFYIGHSVPKQGIVGSIDLRSLDAPAGLNVPSTVDFYFCSNIKLKQLRDLGRFIETVQSKLSQSPI